MSWLYRFDMASFRVIHLDLHRSWLDPVFWVLTSTGLGWVQGLGILSLTIKSSTRRFVVPLLVVVVVSGLLLADVIKLLVPRDRPSNMRVTIWQERELGNNSFPSGHTSTAFGIACLLYLMTRSSSNARVGRWALVWAALVGLSRVYRGIHWPTDALGGAFVGLFSACLVHLWFTRREGETGGVTAEGNA